MENELQTFLVASESKFSIDLFNCGATDHHIIRELDNLDDILLGFEGRCGVGRTSISCASWSRTRRHLCIIIIRFYGGDI